MKKAILLLVCNLFVIALFAQTNTVYPHCNCTETTSKEGVYQLKCGEILIEEGRYIDQKRSGEWISRSTAGNIIIKANYTEGVLDGGYFGDTVPVISRDIVPLSTSKDRDKD